MFEDDLRCKLNLLENIKNKAKKLNKSIIFPESTNERILKACEIIVKEKIARPILIGVPEVIEKKAREINVNLQGIEIRNHQESNHFEKYAEMLYKRRKNKGLTLNEARELLKNPIYFGVMMVYADMADGLVCGAENPTPATLRPALQIIKTKPGVDIASSYFLMIKNGEVLFFADCGMNIDPTPEELAKIAITTADSAKSFGFKPRVAMLSFSTKGSARHEHTIKIAKATEIAKKSRPDILIDGEMQFDAAYDSEVAKIKCPKSPVCGKANIFIFPCLDAGNIAYKITQRLGKYSAIGPIVQGLNKPVNDLSRGCSISDIVDITAITVVETDTK